MHLFNHQGLGSSGIARASAFFILLLLLTGCSGGDDDGRRLGDTIVGTPDELPIQELVFLGDGTYNGMVRKGSFQAFSQDGEMTSEGTYQCDNSNLRLEYLDEYDEKQKLLMQVISFTEQVVQLRYVMDAIGVTITVNIYKKE